MAEELASIPSRCKQLFLYLNCLWEFRRLLFIGYLGLIPGIKRSEAEGDQYIYCRSYEGMELCLHSPIFLYGVCRDSLTFTFTYSFILFYLAQSLVMSQSVIRSGIRACPFWSSKQTFIDTTLQDFGKNGGFVSTEARLMSNSQHALHPGISGRIRYKKNLHKLFLD